MDIVNLFTQEECTGFVAGLQNATWQDGAKSGSAKLKNNFQLFPPAKEINNIILTLNQRINSTLFRYTYFPKELVGVRLVKYGPECKYDWHVDQAIMNLKKTDLSFTIFLNDEYEGGELEIKSPNPHPPVSLKKSPGEGVIYPTSVPHRVKPVISGERIVLVGWISSFFTNHDQRMSFARLWKITCALRRENNLIADEMDEVFLDLVRNNI